VAWQILTAIGAFLFTGRALLFVIGLVLGGMLTVASPEMLSVMQTLVSWWNTLLEALFR
jgi:hypothetical protein